MTTPKRDVPDSLLDEIIERVREDVPEEQAVQRAVNGVRDRIDAPDTPRARPSLLRRYALRGAVVAAASIAIVIAATLVSNGTIPLESPTYAQAMAAMKKNAPLAKA